MKIFKELKKDNEKYLTLLFIADVFKSDIEEIEDESGCENCIHSQVVNKRDYSTLSKICNCKSARYVIMKHKNYEMAQKEFEEFEEIYASKIFDICINKNCLVKDLNLNVKYKFEQIFGKNFNELSHSMKVELILLAQSKSTNYKIV